MPRRTRLMLPGPIDIWEETLDALREQVRPHYGEEFAPIYNDAVAMIQRVFQTKNDIIIMTAPGSGALDAGLASMFSPGDRVPVVDNGPFARRVMDIMRAYDYAVQPVEDAWGQPGDPDKMRKTLQAHPDVAGFVVVANDTGTGVRNPVREYARLAQEYGTPIFVDGVSAMGGYDIPVDDWALDLVVTSSNKALETTPGLGILAVSDRAWSVIESRKNDKHRGWYYNLSNWKQAMEASPDHPYPTTQASSLIYSLYTSLNRITEVETLQGHWARYAWAQRVVRTGLRALGFEMVVADDVASFTVTTVRMRPDIENAVELRDYLLNNHSIRVATAMGHFAKNVLRIGHMGKACSQDYVTSTLLGVEDYLRKVKDANIPVGASLVGLGIQEDHNHGGKHERERTDDLFERTQRKTIF